MNNSAQIDEDATVESVSRDIVRNQGGAGFYVGGGAQLLREVSSPLSTYVNSR